jgi:hypothetical protein
MLSQFPRGALWSGVVATWAATSFENDAASDWFNGVEEAVDPGATISSALDHALAEAEYLDLDPAREAIAAAELAACCAGQPPERLPDNVRRWTLTHPHRPHDSEMDQAIDAVSRVRAESRLRDFWREAGEHQERAWLDELDALVSRLQQSGVGSPPTLSP